MVNHRFFAQSCVLLSQSNWFKASVISPYGVPQVFVIGPILDFEGFHLTSCRRAQIINTAVMPCLSEVFSFEIDCKHNYSKQPIFQYSYWNLIHFGQLFYTAFTQLILVVFMIYFFVICVSVNHTLTGRTQLFWTAVRPIMSSHSSARYLCYIIGITCVILYTFLGIRTT